MAQNTAPPTRAEMPEVTRPDPFDVKALDQLADDGFDAVAFVCEPGRPRRFLALFGFVRR